MNNEEYPRDKFTATKAAFLAEASGLRKKLKRQRLVRSIAVTLLVIALILVSILVFYKMFTLGLYYAIYGIFWVITNGV